MTIGFGVGGGTGNVVPDKGLSRSSTPSVHKISFGDGYEQRIAKGINSIAESYSASFNNRTKEEIDDIIAFLDSQKGVTAFNFTIPDSNASSNDETVIKVVCDTYNSSYSYGDFYSATATFRRVFEA